MIGQDRSDARQFIQSRAEYMDLKEMRTERNIEEQSAHQVADYTPLHPSTRSWEVQRDRVSVEKIIGKGAFGQVAKGTAEQLRGRPGTTIVAIKMLKSMIFHIVKIVYIQLKFSCLRYWFLLSMLLRCFLLFFYLTVRVIILTASYTLDARANPVHCTCAVVKLHVTAPIFVY